MLEAGDELVSVDDHLVEHPEVWTSRLPSRYQEAGPHIVEWPEDAVLDAFGAPTVVNKGSHVWVYEGRTYPNKNGIAALDADPNSKFEAVRFDEMRRGAWDPVERVRDMEQDGIAVQLPFPTFPGFSGTVFLRAEDRELAHLCVKAYNDFLLDEWCAAAPDSFIPMIILPIWDTKLAVAELERCAAKGARAISFPDNPAGPLGLPSFFTNHWDDLFRAAVAHDMPICMHFGTSKIIPQTSADATIPVLTTLFGITLFNSLCELTFSDTFKHHPDLKIVFSEGGIGWLPYAYQRMDQVWDKYKFITTMDMRLDPAVAPSSVAREHVWGCFIDDAVGLELRHEIGVDHILWECDYPHTDSLWPDSRKRAEELFATMPHDEVVKIASANARQLFHFPKSS